MRQTEIEALKSPMNLLKSNTVGIWNIKPGFWILKPVLTPLCSPHFLAYLHFSTCLGIAAQEYPYFSNFSSPVKLSKQAWVLAVFGFLNNSAVHFSASPSLGIKTPGSEHILGER